MGLLIKKTTRPRIKVSFIKKTPVESSIQNPPTALKGDYYYTCDPGVSFSGHLLIHTVPSSAVSPLFCFPFILWNFAVCVKNRLLYLQAVTWKMFNLQFSWLVDSAQLEVYQWIIKIWWLDIELALVKGWYFIFLILIIFQNL